MSNLVALPSPSRSMSASAVRLQLARILQSDGFIHAGRMRRFLEFVVEETLAGRPGQLCEYCIGVSVFDRGESFEPGLDPIVRNDARRLRNKLLEYYQHERHASRSSVVIEIPKGGYVPSFSASPAFAKEHSDAPYRLSVTLVRVADGREILSQSYDFAGETLSVGLRIGNTEGAPHECYRGTVSSISDSA